MIEDDVEIQMITGIIDGGRRIIGDDAIKAANEIEGLDVRSNGEVVVTGDAHKIIGNLFNAFEKAMKGKIVVDIVVRVNLKRGVAV